MERKAIKKNRLTEVERKAFNAILEFVDELVDTFWDPNNDSMKDPLYLYNYFIGKFDQRDVVGPKNVLKSFTDFFVQYDTYIVENKLDKLPKKAKIVYGDGKKMRIEIGALIKRSVDNKDTEIIQAIRQHLLAISSLLLPNESKMKQLEQNTPETEFISNIMDKVKTTTDNAPVDNPMGMIANFMNSGAITEMFSGLDQGINNGTLRIDKLLTTVIGMAGPLMAGATGGGASTTTTTTTSVQFDPMSLIGSVMAAATGVPPPPTSSVQNIPTIEEIESSVKTMSISNVQVSQPNNKLTIEDVTDIVPEKK